MELSKLRIGVYTFTIQAVGQPMRYVADVIFYILWLSIQVLSIFGHHDPSSGKPPGHFQVLLSRNTKYNGLCINRSQKWNKFSKYQATQACSMAWEIKVFLLSYYKELQNGPNWIIVFKQWQTVAGKPVAGLRCFIGMAWRLRVILSSRILFIPPQTLEINRWPIGSG